MKHHLLRIGLLILAGGLSYCSTTGSSFHFDDFPIIVENRDVHLETLDTDGLVAAAFSKICRTRPLPMASFALNHAVGGLETKGYHLVNIGLHLLASVFAYLLILSILRIAHPASEYARWTSDAAFWSALVWTVLPTQTQAVTYIVQRMTLMAGLFTFLALYLYVEGRSRFRGRQWPWMTGAALFALCAFSSKENTTVRGVMISSA